MLETLQEIVAEIECDLDHDPLLILNESELQAILQGRLLQKFGDEPRLTLAHNVINHRPGYAYKCRRVYRELKTEPGRSGREADLVILKGDAQTIFPKDNGAPARFDFPYSAIIETKLDASPDQILWGRPGSQKTKAVFKDIEKWSDVETKAPVFSIVMTEKPDIYLGKKNVIPLKRKLRQVDPEILTPDPTSVSETIEKFYDAERLLKASFSENPYKFLREKDFESYLFNFLRDQVPARGRLHPVRTQYISPHVEKIGRRRRHDFAVLDSEPGVLALEVELKTSHSFTHNWFRKPDVRREFDAMQRLRDLGLLQKAIFMMFRIGEPRWVEDADQLSREFPAVQIEYHCSESA